MAQTNSLGVIFDMDGVLVDSGAAHYEAFRKMGEKLGTEFTEELFRNTFGFHNREIFPLWLGPGLSPEDIRRLAAEKEAIYREIAHRHVKPMEGVIALIDSLEAAGYRMAVGSSGPRANVELAVGVLERRKCFKALVTGDDVPRGKPDPGIFLKAAQELELSTQQCVVIEDAISGIQAAINANIAVVALTSSLPASELQAADLVVDSLQQLSPSRLARVISLRNA